jgi:hypothetical protein
MMDVCRSYLLRAITIAGGLALMLLGVSEPSLGALFIMLVGLVAVVSGVSPPRPSLQ